jgi:hypothetical protein
MAAVVSDCVSLSCIPLTSCCCCLWCCAVLCCAVLGCWLLLEGATLSDAVVYAFSLSQSLSDHSNNAAVLKDRYWLRVFILLCAAGCCWRVLTCQMLCQRHACMTSCCLRATPTMKTTHVSAPVNAHTARRLLQSHSSSANPVCSAFQRWNTSWCVMWGSSAALAEWSCRCMLHILC